MQFQTLTPLDDAALRSHAVEVLGRRLPELPEHVYPRLETLRVIANGPSALRAPLRGHTLALNGALRLFTERGVAPTYWAACDPQELVADFLRDAPESTTYLVASKCHPRVFDTLLNLGRRVVVWHLDDHATWAELMGCHPIRVAPTITGCAPELGERLGYRAFQFWGWDGCYLGHRHHAVDQPEDRAPIELQVGDQKFMTTGSWVLEAHDATNRFKNYRWPMEVKGDGMIGAALRLAWAEEVRELLIRYAVA